MYLLRPMLYAEPQALRAHPALRTISPALTRQIRIKPTDDDDPSPAPPESHTISNEKGGHSLDPQMQNAKSSTGAPLQKPPAYVHGRINKGDGTGGGSTQGTEEAVTLGWWDRLKQLLRIRRWSKESKYGRQSEKK